MSDRCQSFVDYKLVSQRRGSDLLLIALIIRRNVEWKYKLGYLTFEQKTNEKLRFDKYI